MMRRAVALVVLTGAHASLLGQCDTPMTTRAKWALGARARLTYSGFDVAAGTLKYAPIGTISDPAGTYGALLFDEDDELELPNAQPLCSLFGTERRLIVAITSKQNSFAPKAEIPTQRMIAFFKRCIPTVEVHCQ